MMPLAYAGLGWAIGVCVPGSDRRLRLWCAGAALLPEIDRLAALAGVRSPAFFHNVFAGILCLAAAGWFFLNRPERGWLAAVALVGLAFGLHLAMDAKLSGEEIRLFWPLDRRGRCFTPLLGPLPVALLSGVFVVLPLLLAFWKKVTPVELLGERADRLFVNVFAAKNRDCRICGKACNNRCSTCRQPACLRHIKVGWGFRLTCDACRLGSAPRPTTAMVTAGVEDYLARQLSFLRSKEAVRLDAEFASFLRRKLTDGLRRLDDVPRTHPLWEGSDQRPTLAKLVDLSRTVLKEAPDDVESRWVLFADRILTNSPDLEFSAIEPAILRDFGSLRWLVAAARWRFAFSGINPVIALRAPLQSLSRTVGPIEPFLETLKDDPLPATKQAAADCLELLKGRNPFASSVQARAAAEPTRVEPIQGHDPLD